MTGNGQRILFWGDGNAVKSNCGDDSVNLFKKSLNCTLRLGKFYGYKFYLNKANKK